MPQRKRLTLKGFEAWLRGKHGNTHVGYPRSCLFCPLARYARRLVCESGNDPRWVKGFISAIDKLPRGRPITAARALKILVDV